MSEPDGTVSDSVTSISRAELLAKLRDGSIVLVDAQAEGWFEREHLPGALPAGTQLADELTGRLGANLAREIAVYCWSETCDASARIAGEIARRGYTNVRRYVEGKRDWLAAGLPIESGGEIAPAIGGEQ